MNKSKQIEKEAIFLIGKVFSVDGRTVKIEVNKNKNHSHIIYDGSTIKNISVGSYVKILKGFTTIIGKIEGEFTQEEKYFNREYGREETKVRRILQASLFGHYEDGVFRQGIKEMPLLDNECYVLNRPEFNDLHQFADKDEPTITIGGLTEEPAQRIKIGINKLFASHIGIFGNTGSGKSNTLARVYSELFDQSDTFPNFHKAAKFVFIDFNGEYAHPKVLTENKAIYMLSTGRHEGDKYPIAQSYIEDNEILAVLLEATEKTQKPFLNRAINGGFFDTENSYKQSVENTFRLVIKKGEKTIGISILKDLIKDLSKLTDDNIQGIDTIIDQNLIQHTQNGDFRYHANGSMQYENQDDVDIYAQHFSSEINAINLKDDLISRIQLKILLTYYHEIAQGYSNQEHIKPLVGRMFNKFHNLSKVIDITESDLEQNISVISLKSVNLEMKKVLPLIISKQLYDEQKNKDGDCSLNIIIDEAHNVLSEASQRESDTWKDYRLETFEEIIKEGRKFGTFLTIASQRPSDISATIISQLHNYFIHRLINTNDIYAINKTVAYLDKLSFESIPILSVGSCFVAGLATDLPIKVDISLLPDGKRPKSETINLQAQWSKVEQLSEPTNDPEDTDNSTGIDLPF